MTLTNDELRHEVAEAALKVLLHFSRPLDMANYAEEQQLITNFHAANAARIRGLFDTGKLTAPADLVGPTTVNL